MRISYGMHDHTADDTPQEQAPSHIGCSPDHGQVTASRGRRIVHVQLLPQLRPSSPNDRLSTHTVCMPQGYTRPQAALLQVGFGAKCVK